MVTVYNPEELNKQLFLTLRQDKEDIVVLLIDRHGIIAPQGIIGYFDHDKGFVPYWVKPEALQAAGFSRGGIDFNSANADKDVKINIHRYKREGEK